MARGFGQVLLPCSCLLLHPTPNDMWVCQRVTWRDARRHPTMNDAAFSQRPRPSYRTGEWSAALWGGERGCPLPCRCVLIKSRASWAFSKSSVSCSVSVDALPPAPWQGLGSRVLRPRRWPDWTQRGGVWGERCDLLLKVFFSLRNGLPSDSYHLKPVNNGCVLTVGSPRVFLLLSSFVQDRSWLALSITNMLAWHTFLSRCRSLFQSICAAKSAVTVLCSGDAQIEERGMSFLSALCSVLYANLNSVSFYLPSGEFGWYIKYSLCIQDDSAGNIGCTIHFCPSRFLKTVVRLAWFTSITVSVKWFKIRIHRLLGASLKNVHGCPIVA